MKKLIASLLLFVLPAVAMAKTYNVITSMLHHTPIQYSNSLQKESALARGLYFYWGHGLNHSFEGAFDHTWVKYKGREELKQNDFTFLYTNYQSYPYKFTLGAHRISGNLYDENVLVLLGGISNYVIGKQDIQLNFSYSRYGEEDPNLSVFQVTPEYGRFLLKGPSYSFYAKAKVYYIYLDKDIGLESSDLYSIELALAFYYKKLQISGFGWFGEQAFAVRDNGFVVYNLSEKHIGGYGVKIGHSISSKTHVFASYSTEIFEEISVGGTSDAFVGSFSIVHTF